MIFKSKSSNINDNRINEEILLKLEKELWEKYALKRKDILNMKNKLKDDQISLENERNNI